MTADAALRIVPLGGLGEVGMNCMLLEQRAGGRSSRIVIDCGVTFPSGPHGVDVLHPRFDAVLDDVDALAGVVLTHGHEDHIGALRYLVAVLKRAGRRVLDVWGPPYALALVQRQLEEADIPFVLVDDDAQPGAEVDGELLVRARTLTPRQPRRVGAFVIEPLRVSHSIPDALALSLETAVGRVLHSGDFKLDPDPLDAEPSDEARLAELGDAGVALLMSDSTNVLQGGRAGAERMVADTLVALVGQAPGRVVVASFASNVHRLGAIAAAARAHGRRLCLLGRSMHNHAAVARELGRLELDDALLVAPAQAASLPPAGVLYAVTGSQGEPRGALRRLASDQHGDLHLGPGDTVLLSSRVIPGNERAIYAMLDDLLALGVVVRTRVTDPGLHVSGHAHAAEQRRLLELVRPRAFIPVHGTRMHLSHHAEMARELDGREVEVLVNGQVAQLDQQGLRRAGSVPCGRVARAGSVAIDDEALRQRRQLGREGLILVAIGSGSASSGFASSGFASSGFASSGSASSGSACSGSGRPRVSVRALGVPHVDQVTQAAERAARAALGGAPRRDGLQAAERVRRGVRRAVGELLGQRPVVEVLATSEERGSNP